MSNEFDKIFVNGSMSGDFMINDTWCNDEEALYSCIMPFKMEYKRFSPKPNDTEDIVDCVHLSDLDKKVVKERVKKVGCLAGTLLQGKSFKKISGGDDFLLFCDDEQYDYGIVMSAIKKYCGKTSCNVLYLNQVALGKAPFNGAGDGIFEHVFGSLNTTVFRLYNVLPKYVVYLKKDWSDERLDKIEEETIARLKNVGFSEVFDNIYIKEYSLKK